MSKPRYFVGLDLGQTQDFTALTVLERTTDDAGERQYGLRHLERFQLGTSYVQIVAHVTALMSRPPLPGSALVVDMTGVGRPVVDMLRRASPPCRIVPATITGGTHASFVDGEYHVAKVVLVSTLQLLLQGGRLKWSPALPHAALLAKELLNFRVKITKAANETYEAREGEHDDLVLSVALAAWFGQEQRTVVFDFVD